MSAALHLVVTLAICTVAAHFLVRARWVWRAPGTGIVLWQLLAATWVLSVAGGLITLGLDPYDAPIPQALAAWAADPASAVAGDGLVIAGLLVLGAFAAALVWSWCAVSRVRRRHRDVLVLVSRQDDAAPGALVVDHPAAVAYCLPGTPSSIVLSTGALRSLSAPELSAVLAHEHSHARERHDLVLLPFSALCAVLPKVRLARSVARAVALLVEMRADESASLRHGAQPLAAALRRFGTARPPEGALGAADISVEARLDRLAGLPPLPVTLRWSALVGGLVLVATPLSFLFC